MERFSLREFLSNWRTAWRVARLDPEAMDALDAIDAETLLRGDGVDEHFLDWHWRTGCMAGMNVPLERCSAASLLQLVRYIAGVRACFGFPAIGLADLFVPGAVNAIEAGGGRVETGREASAIAVDGARFDGVRLRDGEHLRARWCVVALPPQAVRPLLPPEWCGAPPFALLDRFTASPYISTYLWYRKRLGDTRFWANVWSPDTCNYDFYDLANIRPGHRGGSLIASNVIDASRLPPMEDDEVIATTRRELAHYLPGSADEVPLHASVHRIPMAIPAPTPGTESARPLPSTPIGGVLLAGDWLRTGLPATMESAVRSAFLAAEHILEQAGRPRVLASPLPRMQGLMRLVAGGRLHGSGRSARPGAEWPATVRSEHQ